MVSFATKIHLSLTSEKLTGRVVSTTGTWNRVYATDYREYECSVKGRFKVESGLNATHPVTVGDHVIFEPEGRASRGVIDEIYDRKNYMIRKSPRKPGHVHIVAANVDQAAVVATVAYPRVKQGFIDRFLVTAQAYDIQPLIILNKDDCYSDKQKANRDAWAELYRGLGYQVCITSAESGLGLEALREQLYGTTTLMNGHSGVGKSTLLNALYPHLNLREGGVSKTTQKGQHTTTFSRMYPVDGEQTYIIDTPGIKEFGLVGFEAYEISHFFPEMAPYLNACKFNNCTHVHEPGCAVKKALEAGKIDQNRYDSYIRIVQSLEKVS